MGTRLIVCYWQYPPQTPAKGEPDCNGVMALPSHAALATKLTVTSAATTSFSSGSESPKR
ncbi:hypothetical protein CHH28_17570 [Bacterioplanes sanyensis]|uniref:Uncharacterized protein n=1 Tax=Bacterioplanes sanyensis TaxID=1249553 RepID=A0A222FPD1_9GAMM|nr:hypothetical protein CHH28_17570 [Bacterioplanes sanyensis]